MNHVDRRSFLTASAGAAAGMALNLGHGVQAQPPFSSDIQALLEMPNRPGARCCA